MSNGTYGTPLIINNEGGTYALERVSLSEKEASAEYDEKFIQELAFKFPNCLPIDEIDRAYSDPVPICMELNTPAGPLDGLFITPSGRLIILEAKLWKNPEARRKVVAQVLDYAKELQRWDYEDLQREVSRRLQQKGNVLFNLVNTHEPDLDEARFVDEVHTSLKKGRFLLLILGDGIREGAAAIADFLSNVGNLEFTFGLVELALFKSAQVGLFVQPRVIARTVEIGRIVVELPEGATIVESAAQRFESNDLSELQEFYKGFWTELLSELQLDDSSQKLAKVAVSTNIYFPMPPSGDVMWISAYFSNSRNCVGVYLRFSKELGSRAFDILLEQKQEIQDDLGIPVEWHDNQKGNKSVASVLGINDVFADENRKKIKDYFADTLNRFVNTFRHRLERISEEYTQHM